MKMNYSRFINWLILDGWVAYQSRQGEYGIFLHNADKCIRIYGYAACRHGVQNSVSIPSADHFHVEPWDKVGLKCAASLRRTMRKAGLL
jgi:hypothetical protein